jgi:hypothetical protein
MLVFSIIRQIAEFTWEMQVAQIVERPTSGVEHGQNRKQRVHPGEVEFFG